MEAVYKSIFKINLLPKENTMLETATPEVKREKVFMPKNFSVDQIINHHLLLVFELLLK